MSTGSPQAPSLTRRMAAMVYEGVILFGVLTLAGLVYSMAINQRHALMGREGMQVFLFVVLGIYFVWFWTHGGQTLAAKTWKLRVVGADGAPVRMVRATVRYLLGWLWFLPALAVIHLRGLQGSLALTLGLAGGIVAYMLLTLVLPGRQFLHDRLAGTRIEDTRPSAN